VHRQSHGREVLASSGQHDFDGQELARVIKNQVRTWSSTPKDADRINALLGSVSC
jgi:hypothetical protein